MSSHSTQYLLCVSIRLNGLSAGRTLDWMDGRVYGSIWGYMAVYGGIWGYVHVYKVICGYMEAYGGTERYMEVYGRIWKYVELYGGIWRYVGCARGAGATGGELMPSELYHQRGSSDFWSRFLIPPLWNKTCNSSAPWTLCLLEGCAHWTPRILGEYRFCIRRMRTVYMRHIITIRRIYTLHMPRLDSRYLYEYLAWSLRRINTFWSFCKSVSTNNIQKSSKNVTFGA